MKKEIEREDELRGRKAFGSRSGITVYNPSVALTVYRLRSLPGLQVPS